MLDLEDAIEDVFEEVFDVDDLDEGAFEGTFDEDACDEDDVEEISTDDEILDVSPLAESVELVTESPHPLSVPTSALKCN